MEENPRQVFCFGSTFLFHAWVESLYHRPESESEGNNRTTLNPAKQMTLCMYVCTNKLNNKSIM